MKAGAPDGTTQYLTFRVGGEDYAIRILNVKEIIPFDTVTRVPATPPWIRGVINLRERAVPVIDLALKLDLQETTVSSQTCIVIVDVPTSPRLIMGVMAEGVQQVVELGADQIEPPPAFGKRVRVDYLAGMSQVGQDFVLLLDIERVLSADELLVATAVVDAVAGPSEPPEPVGP